MIEASVRDYGKSCTEVFGKPSPAAAEIIPNFDPSTTIMIGDRIDSDMDFATNISASLGILVMTGVSSRSHTTSALKNICWSESVSEIHSIFKTIWTK